MSSTIEIDRLSHSYGTRLALNEVSLRIEAGEIFGFLGPNGSGKTTLFRILSTLIPLSGGKVSVFGFDLRKDLGEIRKQLGVLFQSPSLDKKLTVIENLRHQGHLYGLSGPQLAKRMDEMLRRVGLADRVGARVENLSGGLQRRVELAKGFLHRPKLLLLDEPSTGLDPGARKDLWDYLRELQQQEGVTILVTTHLMEEAERCDRLGILDHGRLLALDTPGKLRASIGGEVVILKGRDAGGLCQQVNERFQLQAKVMDETVRFERAHGHELIPKIMDAFGSSIDSINLGRPSLEDVFIQLTGHRFWNQGEKEDQ